MNPEIALLYQFHAQKTQDICLKQENNIWVEKKYNETQATNPLAQITNPDFSIR